MKKGDIVSYIGDGHHVLKKSGRYEVYRVGKKDIQVVTDTGYAGVPLTDVMFITSKSKKEK